MKPISFWCDKCKRDVDTPYYREKSCLDAKWYEGICVCGEKLMRYITERHKDPYWYKSEKVRYERRRHAKDLIQPSDPRFKSVYPKEYERLEAVKEANEKKKLDEIKKRDDMYKRFPEKRELLSKLYNI